MGIFTKVVVFLALFMVFGESQIYENGEDGEITGWQVIDDDPSGAYVENVTEGTGHVIHLVGDRSKNSFMLGSNKDNDQSWHNSDDKVLSWRMKFSSRYYIYIGITTQSGGIRYLRYSSSSNEGFNSSETIIQYPLADSDEGEWVTVSRNLTEDLQAYSSDNNILEVHGFYVLGTGFIDDIELSSIVDTNIAPTADAGEDRVVNVGDTIILDGIGSDSDGTLVAYEWREGNVTLSNEANLSYASAEVGTVTLTFMVTDNNGSIASDTVNVRFLSTEPIADSGEDQTLNVGDTIILSGTGSDSDGSIVAYEWREGNNTLSHEANLSYTASEAGVVILTFMVTDDNGSTASDEMIVTVRDRGQQQVYEDAEDGETIGWRVIDNDPSGAYVENIVEGAGHVIHLVGEGSKNSFILGSTKDDDQSWHNGEDRLLSWRMKFSSRYYIYVYVKTESGAITRLRYSSSRDNELKRSEIRISLGSDSDDGDWVMVTRNLTEDLQLYDPDNTIVEVQGFLVLGSGFVDDITLAPSETSANIAPTADAGEDQTINVGDTIVLNGTGSDSDGTIVAYEWREGNTTLSNEANLSYTAGEEGLVTLTFIVTDDNGSTASDEMNITVGSSVQQQVYEDAEDGAITGWRVIDDDPSGAYVENIAEGTGHVIHLVGDRSKNSFMLGSNKDDDYSWHNSDDKVLSWRMKFSSRYYIYIGITTQGGDIRYLRYSSASNEGFNSSETIIQYPLEDSDEGEWVSVTRNLTEDLQRYDANNTILEVHGFYVLGSGFLDDITLSSSEIVGNVTPVADAGEDQTVNVGDTLLLMGAGSDSDGTIVAYEWREGNMVLSNEANLTYTTTEAGTVTLTFMVTDNNGSTARDTMEVTALSSSTNIAPVADAGEDQTVNVGDTVPLTGIGSDSDGSIVAYEWREGNNTLSNEANLSYTSNEEGVVTLTFMVTDNNGSTASDEINLTIANIDTIVPIITLLGEEELNITRDTPYSEAGAEAFDDQDGNISENIIITGTVDTSVEGLYLVKYDVNDSAGNAAQQVIRQVHVVDGNDTIPPLLNLLGSSNVNVLLNSSYSDAGAEAFDNRDGDISSNIVVGGSVDTSIEGVYTLTYDVNDSEGNQALQISRTIHVIDVSFTGSPFITQWKTDNEGESADNQIHIPIYKYSNYHYNYNIEWGDGTVDINVSGEKEHTYSSAGTYTVKITGEFPGITFAYSMDQKKILSLEQWGDISWKSMEESFYRCSNLVVNATDAPNLSAVISMRSMYKGATNFNYDISSWDVSNVVDMRSLFNRTEFNQDINAWDVSNVQLMEGIFYDALSFNQPLEGWNIVNVHNMKAIFHGAESFNQPLDSWNVSNVESMGFMFYYASSFNAAIGTWDVSAVSDMRYMFYKTLSFNQDIGNWDVSSVTRMTHMFHYSSSFNQDIGNWDTSSLTMMWSMFNHADSFDQDLGAWNITNIKGSTGMAWMFSNITLSVENYDSLLNGWSSQSIHQGVGFSAGNSQYSENSLDAREMLTNDYNWIITDGGLVE